MRDVDDGCSPLAVLFDLDGTLLDTARDLAGALNSLRAAHGLVALPFTAIRPLITHGSAALIRIGFELATDDPRFEPLRLQFLTEYRARIAAETCPFEGIPALLDWLRTQRMQWGIVTNKPAWLTGPLVAQRPFTPPPACVISGDTLPVQKPDPAPLLYAAQTLGVAAKDCLYIGDAARDVEAGRRAGMRTLVACYGYLSDTDKPETWGADGLLNAPLDLRAWLQRQWQTFAG